MSSGLTVRRFQRNEVRMPVTFTVADEHRTQVAFSATSGASEPHEVVGRSMDFSSGGAGLLFEKFLPRGTRGVLRIGEATPDETRGRVIFEHEVIIRRVFMHDHQPTYFVGVSFINQADDFDDLIAEALQRIDGPGHTQSAAGEAHDA